jgi:dTDP-4-dehydrorhamnose 3,5-epimerase
MGFAHGFITLADNTEAFYLTNAFYAPQEERGIRFDDRDRIWPDYDPTFPGTAWHTVVAALKGTIDDYSGLRCERVAALKRVAEVAEG